MATVMSQEVSIATLGAHVCGLLPCRLTERGLGGLRLLLPLLTLADFYRGDVLVRDLGLVVLRGYTRAAVLEVSRRRGSDLD